MIDIVTALQALDDAPVEAARVRLRVVGVPRRAAQVIGPSGQPLTTCTAPVPLTPDGRAALEAWAAEAAGAEWPTGARIRLDLEDGTAKALSLMERPKWDQPLLDELSKAMMDASICGLGQAAPNPLLCVMKYFPNEVA